MAAAHILYEDDSLYRQESSGPIQMFNPVYEDPSTSMVCLAL